MQRRLKRRLPCPLTLAAGAHHRLLIPYPVVQWPPFAPVGYRDIGFLVHNHASCPSWATVAGHCLYPSEDSSSCLLPVLHAARLSAAGTSSSPSVSSWAAAACPSWAAATCPSWATAPCPSQAATACLFPPSRAAASVRPSRQPCLTSRPWHSTNRTSSMPIFFALARGYSSASFSGSSSTVATLPRPSSRIRSWVVPASALPLRHLIPLPILHWPTRRHASRCNTSRFLAARGRSASGLTPPVRGSPPISFAARYPPPLIRRLSCSCQLPAQPTPFPLFTLTRGDFSLSSLTERRQYQQIHELPI